MKKIKNFMLVGKENTYRFPLPKEIEIPADLNEKGATIYLFFKLIGIEPKVESLSSEKQGGRKDVN